MNQETLLIGCCRQRGAWPHSGRGAGAVLPANLAVEHHGHDHPEDLRGRGDKGQPRPLSPPPEKDGDVLALTSRMAMAKAIPSTNSRLLFIHSTLLSMQFCRTNDVTGQRGGGRTGGVLVAGSPRSKARS